MAHAQRALRVLAVDGAYLIAFDIAGVIACFVLDVAPLRYDSFAAACAVWFVLGIFCGGMAFGTCGQVLSDKPETLPDEIDRATGWFILSVSTFLLTALGFLFYRLWWRFNWFGGEYFVPDGGVVTLTFFVSILLGMGGARHIFTADAPGNRRT